MRLEIVLKRYSAPISSISLFYNVKERNERFVRVFKDKQRQITPYVLILFYLRFKVIFSNYLSLTIPAEKQAIPSAPISLP